MDLNTRNNILTIVLGILIIGLSYFLYRSIVDPYQEVLDEREMVERERHRMLLVRDALVHYRNRQGNFPPTDGGLDSLVQFLQTDEWILERADSLFAFRPPSVYSADSIVFSPRPPHNRFEYSLNDTIRPRLYLLTNPGTDDRIGDLERTTLLNAPNWN
jgi:type II secretory pathway pseudopilin PulG